MKSNFIRLLLGKWGAIIMLVILGVYVSFNINRQIRLQDSCVEKYSFCIITEVDYRPFGKNFLTYKFLDNGKQVYLKEEVSYKGFLPNNIKIGDTLILFYCDKNKVITNNPIFNGEFIIKSWPRSRMNEKLYKKYGKPLRLPDSINLQKK